MARLPTKYDLSGPASLRSGRMISSADTSAIGAGLSALGAGISSYAKEQVQQQNAVDIARAEAYKTEALLGVQNDFDADPDYATYEKRAPVKTGEVISKGAELIRDPEMREKWRLGAQSDAARVNDGIRDKAFTLSKQADTVALDESLETYRRVFVDPQTPEDVKEKARTDLLASIDMAEKTGKLTPEAAQQRRDTFVKGGDFTRASLAVERDPNSIPGRRGAMGNLVANKAAQYGVNPDIALGIAFIESGLNPNAKAATSSASGLYQFITGTGAQYGLTNPFDPEANADAGARFTRDNINGLRKSLGREPSPGEVYLAHFAGLGRAQSLGGAPANTPTSEIFTAKEIAANRSILEGKTAGQVRAWADRKMAEGMRKAGASGTSPAWMDRLSPEQREKVYQQAETRQNQISVETRSYIEPAVQNAPAAIAATGAYSGTLPTIDQFVQAYGPQDGVKRFADFSSDVGVAETSYQMRTMSAADIARVVEGSVPSSSGDDAALQAERHQALSTAATNTLSARERDPVGYVRRAFPNVDQAWRNIGSPEGYQAAIAATVAAQDQLGMKSQALIPGEAAANAVAAFKNEQETESARMEAIQSLVLSTPDPEQQRAVFEQLVRAGLPDATEGAFAAAARGDKGAAQRLFQAAMIDPSKLPGTVGATPAEIDQGVQDGLLSEGGIGDIYYGLSDGSAENFVRAQRDNKLLSNAVNLRMRSGETLEQAVENAGKDLYGDVQAVNEANARILLPSDVEGAVFVVLVELVLPDVRAALESTLSLPEGVGGTEKAIAQSAISNRIDDILANGYFRNANGGYSFIDPYTGGAIPDANGNPMVFSMPDVEVEQTGAALGPAEGATIVPTGEWRAPAYEVPRTRGGESDVRPMPQ